MDAKGRQDAQQESVGERAARCREVRRVDSRLANGVGNDGQEHPTTIAVDKELLLLEAKDLELVPLPFLTTEAELSKHGTKIVLSKLNPNLNLPQPDRLKQILAQDYGRETDFAIFVNDERVFAFDVPGTTFECEVKLPNGNVAKATYTVCSRTR